MVNHCPSLFVLLAQGTQRQPVEPDQGPQPLPPGEMPPQ